LSISSLRVVAQAVEQVLLLALALVAVLVGFAPGLGCRLRLERITPSRLALAQPDKQAT